MEEKLDFSLPQKENRSAGSKSTVLLLGLLVILAAANLVLLSKSGKGQDGQKQVLSTEDTKQLASKLAGRNLYSQAAEAWQDYLAQSKVSDEESARVLFEIGTLLEKAGRDEEAIEYYYRSEMTAKLTELSQDINLRIKDCFERLGNFSALRYEIMDRTSIGDQTQAGAEIIAEIGAEKITQAQLDGIIENQIDNQLGMYASFMSKEQLNEQKKQALEQFQNPQAKANALQSWLIQEILYRQAIEDGLADKSEVKKTLNEQRRNVLSQQLMNSELALKINITEGDIKTYYQAHMSNYVEPEKAQISYIPAETLEKGKILIKSIKAGENVDGVTEIEVAKGSDIEGLSKVAGLEEQIFAADADTVLAEPVKTDTGWVAVKIRTKQPSRQKSFEEVSQQIMSELTKQKTQDVQQELVKKLMEKYNVIIHTSKFGPDSQAQEAGISP